MKNEFAGELPMLLLFVYSEWYYNIKHVIRVFIWQLCDYDVIIK